jgi:hypothetical protein
MQMSVSAYERSQPMRATTIGLDLAKNIFQVHGITQDDEIVFNRPLRRAQLLPFFSKIELCLIGMEMGWLPPSLNGIAMCQNSSVESHYIERTAK